MKRFSILPAVVVLLLAGSAGATIVAYDGFATPDDYVADTNIAAQAGGGDGAWISNYVDATNSSKSVAASLSYGDLATSDGSLSKSATLRLTGSRTFTNDASLWDQGDQVWFSALFNRSAGGSNFRVLFGAGAGEATGLGFGVDNSLYDVRASIQGSLQPANYNAPTTFVNGDTVFVVGRITVGGGTPSGGSYHVVDVWMNPDLEENLAAVAVKGGDSWCDRQYSFGTTITTMNIYSHQNNAIVFDEIRLGGTQEDVMPTVPEPATLALLGLGGMAAVTRRRK